MDDTILFFVLSITFLLILIEFLIINVLSASAILNTGKNLAVGNGYDEEDKPSSKVEVGRPKNQTEREFILPPPPPSKKNHANSREKQGPAFARAEEDDIFVGDGVEYEVPGKDVSQSPLSEDMEESPRNKDKPSYFAEPSYGPVPPAVLPQGWQESVSWCFWKMTGKFPLFITFSSP